MADSRCAAARLTHERAPRELDAVQREKLRRLDLAPDRRESEHAARALHPSGGRAAAARLASLTGQTPRERTERTGPVAYRPPPAHEHDPQLGQGFDR
ncbi:hypothetical protein ACFWY5_12220 [Nonomuraea sp. NPDC059007]|uniref:hypothetical protein n=1 Tax=Nonomuraea sp. NPDC059007 TaxID=3346692 RepID=UPI00369EBB6E